LFTYLLLVVQPGRTLELRSTGRGFISYSGKSRITILGKLFTPMCLGHHSV